jgi:hypothetical protein
VLIDVKTEVFKVDAVVGEKTTQTMIDGELRLHGQMPDIENIISVDHEIKILDSKIYDQKVTVEGQILFKILYAADMKHYLQPVFYTEVPLVFSTNIDVPGAKSKMKAYFETRLEDLEYQVVLNEKGRHRIISIKALIEVFAKVTDQVQTEIVTHMDGVAALQVLKKKVKIDEVLGSVDSICSIKEEIRVPEDKAYIDEVVKVGIRISEITTTTLQEEVQVDGTLEVSVVYESMLEEDKPVNYLIKKILFSHGVQFPGMVGGDFYSVDIDVTNTHWEVKKDDHECPTILDLEVSLGVKVHATRSVIKEIIVDAYSPTCQVVIDKKLLKISELVDYGEKPFEISDQYDLPSQCPPIIEICDVHSRIENVKCKTITGKVIISGDICVHILYIAEMIKGYHYPLFGYNYVVPFSTYIESPNVEEKMKCQLEIRLDTLSVKKIGKASIETVTALEPCVRVFAARQLEVVIGAEVIPIEDKKPIECPSMIIYIVQPRDTLWKIAKKYNTTVEAIVALNKIETPDLIYPGQKLVICPVDMEIKLPLG